VYFSGPLGHNKLFKFIQKDIYTKDSKITQIILNITNFCRSCPKWPYMSHILHRQHELNFKHTRIMAKQAHTSKSGIGG